jgi:hypothetical protein
MSCYIAAQAAMTHAVPDLLDFGPGSKRYGIETMCANAPIHPSFHETQDALDRRRKGPKIWIQTQAAYHSERYIGNGPEFTSKRPVHISFRGAGQRSLMPSILKRNGNSRTAPSPISDFTLIGQAYIVSGKAARVLEGHNLGKTRLLPIELLDHDDTPIPGDWHGIEMHEAVSSVIKEQCDKKILSHISSRSVLPYEIKIMAGAHGELDLWYDEAISPRVFFFSDRLLKALDKEGCKPRLALKRCDPW